MCSAKHLVYILLKKITDLIPLQNSTFKKIEVTGIIQALWWSEHHESNTTTIFSDKKQSKRILLLFYSLLF